MHGFGRTPTLTPPWCLRAQNSSTFSRKVWLRSPPSAWLLAETGRASRHKSRDTCLEKVVKVWPGTPSKHRDVSMEEDGKGEEERAGSDLEGETEDEEEEMANVEAEFDSDDATL